MNAGIIERRESGPDRPGVGTNSVLPQVAPAGVIDRSPASLFVRGRATRTGVQQYTRRQLEGMGCPCPAHWQDPINVFRSGDDLFDSAMLRSFAGKPVTLGHPPDGYGVTVSNFHEVTVGQVGGSAFRDGEFVGVILEITHGRAISAILTGKVQELSVGWDSVEYVGPDGVAPDDTPYRIKTVGGRVDHVALIPKGAARGGPGCRLLSVLQKRDA